MIAVLESSRQWRLIGRTGRGADVLATGRLTETTPDRQDALARLRDADGELLVTAPDDRHFRWVLLDEEGNVIAQSPPVHRDATQCRDAFHTARRAADVALADHYHPMADTELGGQDHPFADSTTG
jgi:hypothetical protein